jgi:Armadillo/beta-catenin-like repeat
MAQLQALDIPDIVLQVASYLRKRPSDILNMSMVSRLFNWVTHTRHLWTKIGFDVYSDQPFVTTRFIKSLFDGSQLDYELDEVRADINSELRQRQYRACKHLRRLVVQPTPLVQPIINAGLLPRLVQLSFKDDVDLQVEAMWVLSNVSAGTDEQTLAVAAVPGVVKLIELLKPSNHPDVIDIAAWVIANVLSSVSDHRPYHELGICRNVMDVLLGPHRFCVIRSIMDVCEKLCIPTETRSLMLPAIPSITGILKRFSDSTVVAHCCRSLFYLTEDENATIIQQLVDADIGPILIREIKWLRSRKRVPRCCALSALKLVGNVVVGEGHHAAYMANLGLIEELKRSLRVDSRYHFEICWMVSNLVADPQLVDRVLESGILPEMNELYASSNSKTKNEIGWSYINASRFATREQFERLIKANLIERLGSIVSDFTCQDIRDGAALSLIKLVVTSDEDIKYWIRCKIYGDQRFDELKKWAAEQFGVIVFELLGPVEDAMVLS